MALKLTFLNMACACSEITKAVKALDPTATVSVETQTSEAAIKQAISDAGYTVA